MSIRWFVAKSVVVIAIDICICAELFLSLPNNRQRSTVKIPGYCIRYGNFSYQGAP